jgi:hypothetical protein
LPHAFECRSLFVFGQALGAVARFAEHFDVVEIFGAEPCVRAVMYFESACVSRARGRFALAPIARPRECRSLECPPLGRLKIVKIIVGRHAAIVAGRDLVVDFWWQK